MFAKFIYAVRLDALLPVSPSLPSVRRWHNCTEWPKSREQFGKDDYPRRKSLREGRIRPSVQRAWPWLISSSSLRRNCLNFILCSLSVWGRLNNSDRAFDFTPDETAIAVRARRAVSLVGPAVHASFGRRRILNPFEGNRTTFGARGKFYCIPLLSLNHACKFNC